MTDNGASSYHRYLQGDLHALEELVREHSDGILRYVRLYVRDPMTAEDIMEESFATLLVKKKQLPDTVHFKAYLYKIARNKCLDHLRSKRRTERPLFEAEQIAGGEDPEELALSRARDKEVFGCLLRLPEEYRETLYFAYFDGYKVAEICKLTGKSRKKVYNLLARAKAALKKILEKEGVCDE